MYDMICSKTQHADKASKISGMILAQYHGDVDLIDEYVHTVEKSRTTIGQNTCTT